MSTLYDLAEKRRDFIGRQLRTKKPAVIGAGNAAEVTLWKLIVGKALFLETRPFRWMFIASEEPGIHSPGKLLAIEIKRVAAKYRRSGLARRCAAICKRLETDDGCLEWKRLADAVLRSSSEHPELRGAAEELHLFCTNCWQSGLHLTAHADKSYVDRHDEEGEESPRDSVLLPPSLIFVTRDTLLPFCGLHQPLPQPKQQLDNERLVCRVGPFTCGHRLPPGGSGNHNLAFSVMVAAAGVEFASRCFCGAKWIHPASVFQHFRL